MFKTKSFSFTLSIGGKVYKSRGVTLLEALQSLEEPVKIMSKATLIFSDSVSSYELQYLPLKTKRLFWKSLQPIIVKQFIILLGKNQ